MQINTWKRSRYWFSLDFFLAEFMFMHKQDPYVFEPTIVDCFWKFVFTFKLEVYTYLEARFHDLTIFYKYMMQHIKHYAPTLHFQMP